MEVEDFDDDTEFISAQTQPARSTATNRGIHGRPEPRGGDAGNFGLASEAAADASLGLAAELQRLDVQAPELQLGDGFGLEAEANRPQPATRTPGGLPPPVHGRGARSPLGAGGGGNGSGSRAGLGLVPLRPLPSAAQPQRPQDPSAFGLAAETDQVDQDLIPGSGDLGPRAALPASQPLPTTAFGLATETAELRAVLPPPRQLVPPPPLRQQQQWLQRQQPGTEGEYGLEQDVQDATAAGALQPSGAYGLTDEINAADLAAGLLPPPSLPLPPPPPQGQFGLDEELQAEVPMQGLGLRAATMPVPFVQDGQAFTPQLQQDQQLVSEQGYGLAREINDEEKQLQIWSRPLDGTVPLEQLAGVPEEQRWLHLDARQAERIMLDLARQGTMPKVVDLKDVREKLLEASNPPRLAYLATLERAAEGERLPPNCRPSLLQTKLKSGQNRLRKMVEPVLDPGGQGFVDLNYTPDGGLLPETSRVWQFGLSLVQADGVGKTGLQRVRLPCLFIARLALFDRRTNRFLGNVMGLRPEAVSNYDKRWEFNPDERVIVRCGCVQSDPQAGTRLVTDDALSVFVEFNTSYRLAVPDTATMPQNEHKCARLLDEINTCWAMISFKKCITLTREVEISVPLYHGSIYDPQPMTAFYADKRSKAPFWTALKPKESPVLQFRVGPLHLGKPPLVPYAYMPATMLATHDLGTALGAYRMSLALTLARQSGPFAAAADPVLAGFPPLLSDHHLLAEFLTRWRDLTNKMTAVLDADRGCCNPEVLPPLAAMVEAFRRCTIELAPLARCPTIPPRHINNFVEYQGHRLRLVQHYCHVVDPRTNKILGARHPVEPLSHAGFEFLHAPFDVSEVRVCMADRLERPVPFYRH